VITNAIGTIGLIPKQADLELHVNGTTNLILTDSKIGEAVQAKNHITATNGEIQIDLLNNSKYTAINSFVCFSASIDPTNIIADGWVQFSPPEYDEIMQAIKSSGDAKTEWVRKKLVAAARRA